MKFQHLSASLLLFSFAGFSAHGAINKWVDENNQVHYSDSPAPDNTRATPLRIIDSGAGGSTTQKSTAERELELKKAQQASEEAAQQEAKSEEGAALKQKYCDESRSSLRALENSRRIATYDEQGRRVYMDEAERLRRIEEVRQSIAKNCN